ncbi:hypothetical protein D9M68_982040 [compost metagenome]
MHVQVDEAGDDVIVAVQLRVHRRAVDAGDALAERDCAAQPAGRGQDIALDRYIAHLRDSATNS